MLSMVAGSFWLCFSWMRNNGYIWNHKGSLVSI